MKNEEILKMINNNQIEELKEKLSNEIALEGFKSSNKNNFKKIYNHLKKQLKGCRPIFAYCEYQEGYQVFTDTFFGALLVKEDYNPLMPLKEEGATYPNMLVFTKKDVNSNELTLTGEELDNIIAKAKAYQLKENQTAAYIEELEQYFDFNKLELARASLNYNSDDELKIEYTPNSSKYIQITKSSGSMVVVMPSRNQNAS